MNSLQGLFQHNPPNSAVYQGVDEGRPSMPAAVIPRMWGGPSVRGQPEKERRRRKYSQSTSNSPNVCERPGTTGQCQRRTSGR